MVALSIYCQAQNLTKPLNQSPKPNFYILLFSDVMTSLPTNESELQLYRVLQRANLLKYYDSFISHGNYSKFNVQLFYFNKYLQITSVKETEHVIRFLKKLRKWRNIFCISCINFVLWVSECIQWQVFTLLQLISLNFLLLFINHLFVRLQLFVATG